MSDVVDMCNSMLTHKVSFILNPSDLWKTYDANLRKITEKGNWQEVKFLNDDCSGLNSSISNVPNDSGGIYIFILRGGIIPYSHDYIMYIGRAKYTDSQNLRKRVKEYLNDDRPKIMRMRETWGKSLYIKYLPLKDNKIISELEEELIRVIIPPFNEEYSPKIIRQAKKAAF